MKDPQTPQHGPVYRIRPDGGGWEVLDREDRRVSESMRTQADAVAHAKELARRDGSAQILVHDDHGKIVSDFIYQQEERPSLAYDDSSRSTAASRPATRSPGPGTGGPRR